GGSAETYLTLAISGLLRGQIFAVKVFRRLSKPEWQADFLKEIAFLQQCNHPSVMRVFDEGEYEEEMRSVKYPFVVAEYLSNTLDHVRHTAPPMMAKLGYAVQLLSALEYLGSLDPVVIHRDIKPDNIFVKGASCVLGDFGLM